MIHLSVVRTRENWYRDEIRGRTDSLNFVEVFGDYDDVMSLYSELFVANINKRRCFAHEEPSPTSFWRAEGRVNGAKFDLYCSGQELMLLKLRYQEAPAAS